MTSGPIIHITLGKANPERQNGVNAVVHGLAEAQAKSGCQLEVWGLTPTPEAPTFERTYKLRLFKRKAHRLSLDAHLEAAIDALPTNALVHLHGGLLIEFFWIARRLHRRNVAWILAPHGAYASRALAHGAFKKRIFMALFDRYVIKNAAAIHGLSDGSTNGLAPGPRIVVVPNGCAESKCPPAALDATPFRFSFCGRLTAFTKGLDLLVDAFASAELGDARLDVIGDGADRQDLVERVKALGAQETIHLPGPLFGNQKTEALLASDCFVLTSRHEGFPMSLTEAASLGLPLIVSEGTNFADYVRHWDCGLVVEELTAPAIAKALVTMANFAPERRRELGANARRLIREGLSWALVAKRLESELYAPALEAAG